MSEQVNLLEVVEMRNALTKHMDEKYLNMIYQLNTQCADVLKDDLGSQFIGSCGRDLAGELIRNYFDTADYHITVDQLAERILRFEYENDYDPLKSDDQIRKDAYNYNEVISSVRLENITKDIKKNQAELFEKITMESGKKVYKDRKQMDDGKQQYRKDNDPKTDEYTDAKGAEAGRLEVDHIQALANARYNQKYIKGEGADALRKMYNSGGNFAMMLKNANGSKGDVSVLELDGKVISASDLRELKKSKNPEDVEKIERVNDITYKATPEQYADAIIERWETSSGKDMLKDKGYLNEDGRVPKAVKQKLIKNIRHSQNEEGKVILRNADYNEIGSDAFKHTKASIGKIVAGQLVYYTVPPLVYEARKILQNKPRSLDDALSSLVNAATRIGNYVFSKLKDVFKNVVVNTLKNFIKVFMDILINMIKATIKKIMKLAKNLILSTVDAIVIIATKGSTPVQKADAVVNLFGVTITTFTVDTLFEVIKNGINLPDFLVAPLQILTTVVCTNLTMLILQKADLFDVRFGYKVNQVQSLFKETANFYAAEIQLADYAATNEIDAMIEYAKDECYTIFDNLRELNPYDTDVRRDLEKLNVLFNTGVQLRPV